MLVIRDAQMQALARQRTENFLARARRHLTGLYAPDAAQLEQLLQKGVPKAQEFQLTTEQDVIRFLEIAWREFGGVPAEFDRPALAILRSYGMAPDEKLRRFAEYAEKAGARG